MHPTGYSSSLKQYIPTPLEAFLTKNIILCYKDLFYKCLSQMLAKFVKIMKILKLFYY